MGKGMKAGKRPKPAGGGNMQKQMQQMQMMQKKMDEVQAEIDAAEISASSGGGAVEVTVSGKKQIVSIDIQKEVVDPDDVEMLQDLIMAAVNEAMRQVEEMSQEKMGALSSSLGLPQGMI